MILLTHPDLNDPGGVSAYINKIKDKLSVPVFHFVVGKRPSRENFLIRLFKDYYLFIKNVKNSQIKIVHVNPSLKPKSFFRDGIFVLLAKFFRKKVIVFFHGWDATFEKQIERRYLWVFKFLYGKSDAFIVLANDFKNKLEFWGF